MPTFGSLGDLTDEEAWKEAIRRYDEERSAFPPGEEALKRPLSPEMYMENVAPRLGREVTREDLARALRRMEAEHGFVR